MSFYVTVLLDDYKSPSTLLFFISENDLLLQIRKDVNASFQRVNQDVKTGATEIRFLQKLLISQNH